jgi:hypothetical protein
MDEMLGPGLELGGPGCKRVDRARRQSFGAEKTLLIQDSGQAEDAQAGPHLLEHGPA